MSAVEQIETRSKKGRGMAKQSLDLIEAMAVIAEKAKPITGRGVGYKLFTCGLIPSMETKSMQRVYRLLKEGRERGIIPWSWIVDETRDLEHNPGFANPEEFISLASRSYHRDLWNDQPRRVEVWSEKGTVRGLLGPILDGYGVGFRAVHGFCGAATVYDVAQDFDGRPFTILYVGDHDPSGMWMSEVDLPNRLRKYGGDHVRLVRIALKPSDLPQLPSFAASDKAKDKRYRWFVKNYGDRCWELDAMDPNDLRDRVRSAILAQIEPTASPNRRERRRKEAPRLHGT